MTRLILSWLLLTLLSAPAGAAKTIECVNPDTDEKFKMSMRDIKRSVKILTKELGREQVHALDLPEGAQNDVRDLAPAIAAKDWCKAANIARRVEDAIYNTRVHPEFVNQKFRRVELWVRGGEWDPATQVAAERLIAIAAAKISEGDHVAANKQLNKTIDTLFGTKGLWDLPERLPDISSAVAGESQAEIRESDVKGGCPKLAEKGRGKKSDLDDVKRRIKRAMNDRHIRTQDLEDGEALAADLGSYERLRAIWPAIRVACALLNQVKTIEIDLGLTMARYHRVGKMRRGVELSEADDERFRELVRATSDAIAATDFVKAHGALEEILVLLGEPGQPSDTIELSTDGG